MGPKGSNGRTTARCALPEHYHACSMDPSELSKDEVDEDVWRTIVTDPIRNEVLEVLADTERPMSLADLAIELARRSDTGVDDMEWNRAKQLRTTLHKRHVLKLQYVGLVEFDPERMTVTLAQKATPNASMPATSGEDDR